MRERQGRAEPGLVRAAPGVQAIRGDEGSNQRKGKKEKGAAQVNRAEGSSRSDVEAKTRG